MTMNSRPKDPRLARNKNVMVVGGSGSGKTRFWLKPNLMQCHSSYVVTDPKGSVVVEFGQLLLREGYCCVSFPPWCWRSWHLFALPLHSTKEKGLLPFPRLRTVRESFPLIRLKHFLTFFRRQQAFEVSSFF